MRLTARERKTVWAGVVFAALALAYQYWWGPLLERRTRLASQVETLRQEAQRVSALGVRYRELQQREKAFDRLVGPGWSQDSLLRSLDLALRELGLKDRLVSASPGHAPINRRYAESSLQVRLVGLKWQEVIRLLHRLEDDKMRIWVKRFRLVADGGTKRLNGEFSLSAFVKRGQNGKKGD